MSWRRRIVFVLAGFALVVAALWYWALHTNSGARWAWAQAQSASGGNLHADAIDGDLSGGLSLLRFEFKSDAATVQAKALSARIDVDLLPLQVEILTLSVDDVSVRLAGNDVDTSSKDDDDAIGDPQTPVKLVFDDVEATDVRIEQGEELLLAISRIAIAGDWHEEDITANLQVAAEAHSLSADIEGTISAYRYHVLATTAHTPFGELTAEAIGSGGLQYVLARSLRVGGDGVEAAGSAELSWDNELEGSAALDVETLDLSGVVDDWPIANPLNGQVRLRFADKDIVIEDTVVRISDNPAIARFDLLLDRESGVISGEVAWSNLAWPLQTPTVTSKAGNVQVDGTLDDWRVTGTIDVGTEQMPEGRFTLAGGGDRDSASARIDEGRAFGGAVSGDVAYRWRGEQPWTATLTLADVETTAVFPAWPGRVSGGVQAKGSSQPFRVAAQVDGIEGVLRELPLRANGGFEYDGFALTANDLRLETGGTYLRLDGSTHGEDGLQFFAEVDELADYVDQVAGNVVAEGRITADENRLVLTANSDQLSIADQTLNDISVSVDYSDSSQGLALDGSYSDRRFGLSMTGTLTDWQRPLDSVWNGVVDSLEIHLADDYVLQLQGEATLTAARDRASLQNFCVTDNAGGNLCIEFSSEPGSDLNVAATLTDIPAMLSEHFVDHTLVFTQRVNGNVSWQSSRGGDTQGQGDLRISAGHLSSANDSELVLETGEGRVGFMVRNQRLLAGNLFVPLPNVGQIDAEFAVLDVRQGVASEVTGKANLSMSEIGIVADFLPVIDSIAGTLESSLTLAGTVGAPELTGTLNVNNGEIFYAPIGLRLREIDLRGDLQANRSFELSGGFRAGDGYGNILSSADYSNADYSGLKFKVQGKDLRLINVPNLQAVIAPDFEVTYDQRALGINGSVDVTRARIAPTNLADGRVNESEDVVIVAGDLPDANPEPDDEQRIEYFGVLDVTLGESVVVDLDVARANLGGGVSFEWQGDALPIADGRVNIAGSVEAFGQVLDVTEGIINFPTVPANNPNVRVRAEREIYGNSQVKRAGILVDGHVDRPTIEPYTVPMTTEERALTLLVTGSDFDYEQGVGSFDFGTYIAPRLFVSYGIGIFDHDNVISARYDLSSGFGIKASSGNKESGFDLNYRFEN